MRRTANEERPEPQRLLVSTILDNRWSPEGDDSIVYTFATPTRLTRQVYDIDLQRGLRLAGVEIGLDRPARFVGADEIRARLEKAAVSAIDGKSGKAVVRKAVKDYYKTADAGKMTPKKERDFGPIEAAAMERDPEIATLQDESTVALETAARVILRHFLTGWAGIDVTFERVHGRIPDGVLDQLPPPHRYMLFSEIMAVLRVKPETAKN